MLSQPDHWFWWEHLQGETLRKKLRSKNHMIIWSWNIIGLDRLTKVTPPSSLEWWLGEHGKGQRRVDSRVINFHHPSTVSQLLAFASGGRIPFSDLTDKLCQVGRCLESALHDGFRAASWLLHWFCRNAELVEEPGPDFPPSASLSC